ncbi:6-bladed beta-propeller [Gemmatimonadota bacterium]
MTRICLQTAGLILSVQVISCSHGQEESDHSFRIYEEDGITIAETSGGPKYEEELFEYEEYLRLEQDETNPESLFSRPYGFSMGSDGSYYILDGAEDRVVTYLPDGRFSHSIGSPGTGPGEFQGPRYLSVSGDVVSVYDGQLRRISLFATDGTFDSSVSLTNQPYSTLTAHVGPGNELVCIVRRMVQLPQEQAPYSMLSIRISSSRGDSVAAFDSPMLKDANPQADYVPGVGIYVSGVVEPWIHWFNLNGDLTRIIRVEETRLSVSERGKPWLGIILVEENGTMWARIPSEPGDQFQDNHAYRLFSPEGEYLGDTTCPKMAWNFANGYFLTFADYPSDITPIVYRMKPAVKGW